MTVEVRPLTGDALADRIEEVARLRIEVFRDFPYLYDGDMDYERGYVAAYVDSPGAIVAGAFDGEALVGAATGTPLADHAADFAAAFSDTGYRLEDIFYCAESVLLHGYRGRGIGHRFFDIREDHARSLRFRHSAFCAVVREADHPAQPDAYRSLDAFWRGRGYHPLAGVVARFRWRDMGEAEQTEKPLQFWLRDL